MSSLYRPLPDDALRIVAKGRKRTCLPRACTYKVVSCRAGAATRRNREGLARAPPLEGHDNARVLMHSYHPIVASWVFEKIVSFAHPLWFLKTAHARDLDSLRGQGFERPRPGATKAAHISTLLGLACSRGCLLAFRLDPRWPPPSLGLRAAYCAAGSPTTLRDRQPAPVIIPASRALG
jgi:hypothetical protein